MLVYISCYITPTDAMLKIVFWLYLSAIFYD